MTMETLYLILTNVIGGSCYPAITVALRGFTARDAVFLRMLASTILFAPILWRSRKGLAGLSLADWARMAAVGLFGYALPVALGIYGQKLSSAASASLLLALEPVSIVLLSCLFLGESLTGIKALSLTAGLAGTALIAFQGLPSLGLSPTGRLAGDLLLAAAGVSWALYTVIGKPLLSRVRPLDYTAATTLFGFLGVAAWASPGLEPAAWRSAGLAPWLCIIYLAAGGNFLGALLWNLALEKAEASRLANFIFLQPLVGVTMGAFCLGDALTAWTLAGGTLVLAGTWAALRPGLSRG